MKIRSILRLIGTFLTGAPDPTTPTPPCKVRDKLILPYASGTRGADVVGRRNVIPDGYTGGKLRLERLRFIDEHYDTGAAFWGAPENVWCAWSNADAAGRIRIFVRAESRELAKLEVISVAPNARFYR